MTDADFNSIVHIALGAVKKNTPYKTGNLRHNATRLMAKGGRTFIIYVDTEQAPYFKYVNGKRGGRSIRSTGYWRRGAYEAANQIARAVGGKIKK